MSERNFFRDRLDGYARQSHRDYFNEHLSVNEREAIAAGTFMSKDNPVATISDVSAVITTDESAAIQGATSPSASNVFMTFADRPVTIGTPVNAVAAAGTITVSDTPVADETMDIGTITYTFKAERTGASEITIDADNAVQVTNIITAITADDTSLTATDGDGDTVVVTNNVKGVIGNSVAFTSSATGIAVDGSGTLGTTVAGVDGTVGVIDAKYFSDDKSTIYVAMKANTIADANWMKITMETL